MRRRIAIALCLLLPCTAWANPYMLNPSSLITFYFVAFWALVVESGIVALLLVFRGLNPLRIFLAYSATNILVFLLAFEPLASSEKFSVLALEGIVVALDGFCLKLLTHIKRCKVMISKA